MYTTLTSQVGLKKGRDLRLLLLCSLELCSLWEIGFEFYPTVQYHVIQGCAVFDFRKIIVATGKSGMPVFEITLKAKTCSVLQISYFIPAITVFNWKENLKINQKVEGSRDISI